MQISTTSTVEDIKNCTLADVLESLKNIGGTDIHTKFITNILNYKLTEEILKSQRKSNRALVTATWVMAAANMIVALKFLL